MRYSCLKSPFFLLLFVCTLLVARSSVASAQDDMLDYHKVTWEDFDGPVPEGEEPAYIAVGVEMSWEYRYRLVNGTWTVTVDAKVRAVMDPSESGVDPDFMTDDLLAHEQYHFDISQYVARQLEKDLRKVKASSKDKWGAEEIVKEQVEELDLKAQVEEGDLQFRYDWETDHGRNQEKQEHWCTKIHDLIRPGPPNKERMSSTPNPGSTGAYDSNEKTLLIQARFDELTRSGNAVKDTFLKGALLQLPAVQFQGFHMEEEKPLFYPFTGQKALAVTVQGAPVFSGVLRLLTGQGRELTAWIEEAQFDAVALTKSPMLRMMKNTLGIGHSTLTLQIQMDEPIEQLTANFTQSATFAPTVSIGTAQGVRALTFSPGTLVAGWPGTGKVTLAFPAPIAGALIAIRNYNPAVTMPEFVVVPQGQTSVTFPVTTASSIPTKITDVVIASFKREGVIVEVSARPAFP